MSKILLIDDEAAVLTALSMLLKAFGHEVYSAGHPDLIIKTLEEQVLDFVVSDLRMPLWDGWQVLQNVRIKNPELPFILMSGHATEQDQTRLFNYPKTAFLQKPFGPKEFNAAVTQSTQHSDSGCKTSWITKDAAV